MRLTKDFLENELKTKDARTISREQNCAESWISILRKKWNLRDNIDDRYVGKKFGKLRVLYRLDRKYKSHVIYQCECECGIQIPVICTSLISDNTTSCGCSSRQRGASHPHYRGYKEISSAYWNTVVWGAKNRNIELGISKEYAWDIYIRQNRKCNISGLDISFSPTRKLSYLQTASLDRIDSNKDYMEGNIQWVHKKVNQMKWDLTQEEFIEMCHLISVRHREVDAEI